MNRDAILHTIKARMEAIAQERLTDSVERMIRDGLDEDMISDFLGAALEHNRAAVAEAMASAAECLDRNGVMEVRTFTFTDARHAPSVH